MDHGANPAWMQLPEWPFESRWLELAAGRMHYVDAGRGTPVVFVHGTPAWSWEWRHAAARLLSAGRRVVLFDHIGFGQSSKPVGWNYSLGDHTRNLLALTGHLGIERMSLVVHDIGAAIALPLAIVEPLRLERLVIVNSWLWPLAEVYPWFKLVAPVMRSPLMRWLYLERGFAADTLLPRAWGTRRPLTADLHRCYRQPLADRVARQGTWAAAEAVTDRHASEWQLWRKLERLSGVPTSIIWGKADKLLRPANLERWRQLMPHAAVHELEDVGHFPSEEAPEEVAAAITRALT